MGLLEQRFPSLKALLKARLQLSNSDSAWMLKKKMHRGCIRAFQTMWNNDAVLLSAMTFDARNHPHPVLVQWHSCILAHVCSLLCEAQALNSSSHTATYPPSIAAIDNRFVKNQAKTSCCAIA